MLQNPCPVRKAAVASVQIEQCVRGCSEMSPLCEVRPRPQLAQHTVSTLQENTQSERIVNNVHDIISGAVTEGCGAKGGYLRFASRLNGCCTSSVEEEIALVSVLNVRSMLRGSGASSIGEVVIFLEVCPMTLAM